MPKLSRFALVYAQIVRGHLGRKSPRECLYPSQFLGGLKHTGAIGGHRGPSDVINTEILVGDTSQR